MQQPVILFIVNGPPGSAMATRAQSFQERLGCEFRTRIAFRSRHKVLAIGGLFWLMVGVRPAVCYVLDMGFSGVLAAGLYRAFSRRPVIVDTGDAIYELSRSSGNRGTIGLYLTKLLERFAFAISDRVVVRSHPHQELLARQGIIASVIPDGVDTRQFYPRPENELRRKYALDGSVIIGLLGSVIWNSRYQMCYGLELVELIDQLRDLPIKGMLIGDGSGLVELKKRCTALELNDRILFVGRIPYHELPQYLNLMDICLSTQTNDLPGQVRTTGKLPLYLACGRFVLASQVGEAARVLPPEMLVPYDGTKDETYSRRLADRVRWLLESPEHREQRPVTVAIAKKHFDYDILADKVRETILAVLQSRCDKRTQEPFANGSC